MWTASIKPECKIKLRKKQQEKESTKEKNAQCIAAKHPVEEKEEKALGNSSLHEQLINGKTSS